MKILKVIKRVSHFDNRDFKHIGWLFGVMVKKFIKGELTEAEDAWIFIKMHLEYDSTRIDKNGEEEQNVNQEPR